MISTDLGASGNPALSYRERCAVAVYEHWLAGLFPGPAAWVTLTMKQGMRLDDGTWGRLTRDIATKQIAWFLRELDRHVLGIAATRFKRKMGRIVFIEGGTAGKNLHAHLILEIPPSSRMTNEVYMAAIKLIWEMSEWGRSESNFQICYFTPGCIGYSFKTGTDAIEPDLSEPPHYERESKRFRAPARRRHTTRSWLNTELAPSTAPPIAVSL
jgi:hypothetical protein